MQQSFLSRFNKIKLDISTRSTTEKLLITLLLVALINSLKFLLKDLINCQVVLDRLSGMQWAMVCVIF